MKLIRIFRKALKNQLVLKRSKINFPLRIKKKINFFNNIVPRIDRSMKRSGNINKIIIVKLSSDGECDRENVIKR